ncbi:hypothetical protein V8J36_21110 [Frigidibacter sp. MR17.14]|uniref:hypothetical protein n=1 Tax=Frigidibacter sp. MR17.14 TaxID=3126509 RepID=UPI003012FDD9
MRLLLHLALILLLLAGTVPTGRSALAETRSCSGAITAADVCVAPGLARASDPRAPAKSCVCDLTLADAGAQPLPLRLSDSDLSARVPRLQERSRPSVPLRPPRA